MRRGKSSAIGIMAIHWRCVSSGKQAQCVCGEQDIQRHGVLTGSQVLTRDSTVVTSGFLNIKLLNF